MVVTESSLNAVLCTVQCVVCSVHCASHDIHLPIKAHSQNALSNRIVFPLLDTTTSLGDARDGQVLDQKKKT